jgi:hypothetical protein
MVGIVDRIEENIVVIEIEEKMYEIDINLVNGNISEGDVVEVYFNEEGKIENIIKNETQTKSRKEYIEEITKDMWE